MQAVYFIILIGVLIFIHEFGHYFFAKLFGVKVERFSIGMGPIIRPLSFRRGDTEYTISALPIGGYVKMFGMNPEELYDEYGQRLPEEEVERAFVRKPLWQRAIVILAGPAANLIFPIFIYFFFALGTSTLPPAAIGQVLPGSPASVATPVDAPGEPKGLQAGDRILAIGDQPVRYWLDLTEHVRGSVDKPLRFTVQRSQRKVTYDVTPESYTETDRLGLSRDTYGIIGVTLESYGPIVGLHDKSSPAATAGLLPFDRIVSINKKPISRFVDIQPLLDASEGKMLDIVVTRPKAYKKLGKGLQFHNMHTFQVNPNKTKTGWSIGIVPASMFLADVEPESPAAKAGLQVGDEIVAINDNPYNKMRLAKLDIQQIIWEKMHEDPDVEPKDIHTSFALKIKRGDKIFTTTYKPIVREIQGEFNEPVPEIWFGLDTYQLYEMPEAVSVPWDDRFALAVQSGFRQTFRFTRMLFNGILHLIQGRVSTDTVGGPIMIFDIAGRAGRAGIEPFLRMMAIISINLGLVNLLPIPVLDGGHLMLFAIEAIKRKELTQRTRQIAYYVGFSMIVFLMLLAFKNDIERYWQDFAEWFNV